jgi:hypothetical protein
VITVGAGGTLAVRWRGSWLRGGSVAVLAGAVVIGVAPKNSETATGDGLSQKRLCRSVQAAIRLSSESKERQLAKSSANESNVRSWAASFS